MFERRLYSMLVPASAPVVVLEPSVWHFSFLIFTKHSIEIYHVYFKTLMPHSHIVFLNRDNFEENEINSKNGRGL